MEVKGVVVVEDAGSQSGSARAGRLEASAHVANRPIADHVLDVLESAGVHEIVVASSNEHARDIRECLAPREALGGFRMHYLQQPGPIDIAGALSLAAPVIGGAPCIVHLASGLLDEPLEPVMDRVLGDSPDVVLILHQGLAPHEHLSPATQEMLKLAELDPERAALSMAGVCLFGPEALSRASTANWRAGSDIDVTMVAERIESAGGSLHLLPVSAWRSYAGDPLDLLELNRIALDRLRPEMPPPSNHGNRIEGRVLIHEHASVRASVIVGPTVIGPGAQVADAYIGPYTSVGAGARIEGAEIERSIVAAGASITHVGGRLVASVVGRDARVFRDFSLPRALRLRVGDGTVVGLC
jgi:glucose-1-phosphate thymidylyltransferase